MRRARLASILSSPLMMIALASFVGLATKTAEARPTEPAKPQAAVAGSIEPPPRPPLTDGPETTPLLWDRHADVGGDFVFVQRPASTLASGGASSVRYAPAIGYGVHARWTLFRFVSFSAYYRRAYHEVILPPGALDQSGSLSLDGLAKTYSFGARVAPTLAWNSRARTWISAGVGWGRVEIGRMKVKEGAGEFTVQKRAASFGEIPLSLGTSFDVIPRWLAIELEVTGSFIFGQEGELREGVQAIDAAGKKRAIGGFPDFDATFVETIGLSLIL